MIKIKNDDKELSIHILQNPTELSAVLFELLGDAEQYDMVIRLDKHGLVTIGFDDSGYGYRECILRPESREDEWVEVDYQE